ncbi:MAG: T9SS type A sorting domain-containing protein [Saprospiraceae bacterium]|nr:T9SS type A sorting domain-containing protein [Saprospiraceae bacterium]
MTNKPLFTAILIFFISVIHQPVSAQQFSLFERFGATDADLALHQLLPTHDGGALLVCSRSCYLPGGVVIEGCLLNMQLIRVDENGQLLWKTDIPTFSSFFKNVKVTIDSENNFVLTISEPTSFECQDFVIGGFGWDRTTAYFVSSTGELEGEMVLQESCTLQFEDMKLAPQDNKLLLCNANTEPFVPLYGRLIRLDKDNNILWERNYDENYFGQGKLLMVDDQTWMILYKEDNLIRLSKLDDEGEIAWSETLSDDQELVPSSILLTDDQHLMAAYTFVSEPDQLMIQKLTLEGVEVTSTNFEASLATRLVPHENFLVFASTILSENADDEMALHYINTDGELLEMETISEDAWERPRDLAFSADGDLWLAGNWQCCEEGNFEPAEVFLAELDSLITNSKEVSDEKNIQFAPNPFSNQLNLHLPNLSAEWREGRNNANIRFFDETGKEIHRQTIKGATLLSIQTTNWPKGIYFFQLWNQESVHTGKLIKQ